MQLIVFEWRLDAKIHLKMSWRSNRSIVFVSWGQIVFISCCLCWQMYRVFLLNGFVNCRATWDFSKQIAMEYFYSFYSEKFEEIFKKWPALENVENRLFWQCQLYCSDIVLKNSKNSLKNRRGQNFVIGFSQHYSSVFYPFLIIFQLTQAVDLFSWCFMNIKLKLSF